MPVSCLYVVVMFGTLASQPASFSTSPGLGEAVCPATGCNSTGGAFVQLKTGTLSHVMLEPEKHGESDSVLPSLSQVEASGSIAIVSYNMYWWKVGGTPALYNRLKGERPFDLFGCQECGAQTVIQNCGLNGFDFYEGPKPNPAPLAWNTQVFSKIGGPGNKWVADDKWGDRHFTWVRLRHTPTGANIFFANTHGPLGNCGTTLGNNWVSGVKDNRQAGDIVFMTGDFNCGSGTPAMKLLKGLLPKGVDGGIDQILTDQGNKESGGKREGSPSDHPLIKASFSVSGSGGGSTGNPTNPTAGGNQFGGTSYTCAAFSQWPNVDSGITCGSCSALVLADAYGGRCDTYCQSFRHTCMAAAEEQDENCQIKYSKACNQAITGTSDMLCTCQKGGATNSGSQQGTGSTPQTSGNCNDDNEQCNAWAGVGECEKNPAYMHDKCKSSCNVCPQSGPASQGSTSQPSSGCRDDNGQCGAWAADGECTKNPQYMSLNCKNVLQ